MIRRIVKLHFQPSYCKEFESSFNSVRKIVESSPGCRELSLLKSTTNNIYFTLSVWDTEQSLEAYRASLTFKNIWSQFKPHFASKAEAWSTKEIAI